MWEQVRIALNQSTTGFITRLARILPGFVALILALLVSLVLAWVVGFVVRRLLVNMRFDERLAHWGFSSPAERSRNRNPTAVVTSVITAVIVASGLLIGIEAFDSELTSALVRSVFSYLPNIVGALFVLFVGVVAARFLSRTVLIGAVNLNLNYARLLSAGVKWLVNVLAVAMALEHLKIAVRIVELAFGILFGGIVLALALAIGLGSKDLITKTLERDVRKPSSEAVEEPYRHI
jgi:ABC-type multidrug transport system fused ATPase/permease subunit